MRSHWQKCHNIELAEVFVPFVVPDATIKPFPVFNIEGTKKVTGRGRSNVPVSLNQAVAKPVSELRMSWMS